MMLTPAPTFGALSDRVGAVLVALALGLGVASSPATVVAAHVPPGPLAGGCETSASTVLSWFDGRATPYADPDAARAACSEALREAQVAQRLLGAVRGDLAPEFDAYLTTLDAVLSHVPDRLDVAAVVALSGALRVARVQLEADVSTFRRWSRVVRAIDPELTGALRVPARFVAQRPRLPETPIVVDESDVRVDRAVREFSADHDDPPTG